MVRFDTVQIGCPKNIINLLLIFFILIHSIFAYAQKDLSALVKKVAPSVVVINVFDKGGNLKGLGTGFFIEEEGLLVTTHHVIEGGVRACVFRRIPDSDSDASRTPIPIHSGQSFRLMPDTL